MHAAATCCFLPSRPQTYYQVNACKSTSFFLMAAEYSSVWIYNKTFNSIVRHLGRQLFTLKSIVSV